MGKDMKLPKTKKINRHVLAAKVWLAALVVFLLCLAGYHAQAQCYGDDCYFPQELTAPPEGEVSCALEVCNGTEYEWYCSEENQGYIAGCFTEEYDYWVRLTVPDGGHYILDLQSNYSIGIQMAVYSNDNCTFIMSLYNPEFGDNTSPCGTDPSEGNPNQQIDLWLEEGIYMIQIDGFGYSYGCGQLCVYHMGFLSGVRELVHTHEGLRIKSGKYLFNLQGKLVGVVEN